jgi:3',5'-cyclic AMP phosphodiesterase CpdA
MTSKRISRRSFLGITAGALGFGNARLEAAEPLAAIGMLADAQYCDCESAGRRFYRNSLRKMEECVREFSSRKLDFVIQLGDLIDRDFESFSRILPLYEKTAAPSHHVLGNHDFAFSGRSESEPLNTLGLTALGSGKGYFGFTAGDWQFVVLNGNDVSTYANSRGSEKYRQAETILAGLEERKAPNAQSWNGGIGEEQMGWLRATLGSARRAKRRAVLFCHFPVFPGNAHNLYNDDQVLHILDAFPEVVAWFSGHNHAGNYAERNGVHHVTLSGMVETESENSFAVVELHPDRLEVIGFGRERSRTLRIVGRAMGSGESGAAIPI